MTPGLRAPYKTEPTPNSPVRRAVLGLGLALTASALAAALFAIAGILQPSTSTPQAQSSIEIADPPTTSAPALPPLPPSDAPVWRVDPRASSIGFAFSVHDEEADEDTRFEGRFTRWRADIRFDPANLDQSAAAVSIETASATDGVQVHDNWLPQAAWFDSANHPAATFVTTEIRREGEGYDARGELTIRGRRRSVRFPFTLVISGDHATMRGQLTIDRRDFDVGKDTDADALVSRDVVVTIQVDAVRAQ